MGKRNAILNPILARWFQAFELTAPNVDCNRCTLSLHGGPFRERWALYKCCTFQPFVANFYAGALLELGLDPLAIEAGKAVLQPLGVLATRKFREAYYASDPDSRGEAHLCSFYNRAERNCKIWPYRPGECSLYFCSQGKGFETLSRKAFVLESSLAQMALAYYGLSRAELSYQVECLNRPEERMKSIEPGTAREIYAFAWKWLQTQDPAEVWSWVRFDNVDAGE